MEPSGSVPPSSITREAELAIVGAGPVGLYAAYYAGFRGLDTLVLEALPMTGGQITTFYADTPIFDVPGFPAITGGELVHRLETQMASFPIDVRLAEDVVGLERHGDQILVSTNSRRATNGDPSRGYLVRAVLVAAGIGSFSPQRIKDPEIAGFEGRGLTYDSPSAESVSGARVFVFGGSQHAVQVAVMLSTRAAELTLVHRRDRLTVNEDARRKLEASRVRFLPFHDLAGVSGDTRVGKVRLVDRRGGAEFEVAADLVVLCYGFHADTSSLQRFGVRLEGDAIVVDSRMASDSPGIYAAGDGATYPGKVRVLAADFGEACTAVNNIAAAIVPNAQVFPGYSSHRKGAPRRPG